MDAKRTAHGAEKRPKLLLIERKLDTQGGVAAVAAWMLQALSRDYDVTLLCWKPPDLDAMNRFFGTSLRAGEFKVIGTNAIIRRIVDLDPDPGSIQSWCVLLRRCQRIKHCYDLVLGGEIEADFGIPGIQYLVCSALRPLYPRVWRDFQTAPRQIIGAFLRGELRPWMLVGRFSFERMKKNVTLTDSDWIGDLIRQTYGIETTTIYPPAGGNFVRRPWSERQNSFVCVGRLNRDKRVDWIIETLARVRREVPDLQLHIAGSHDEVPGSVEYRRELGALIRSNASWVHLHENVPREQLVELLSYSRYGIHAHLEEHFGIAVAEMLLAGIIPFVYDNGGPAEIVEHDPRLIYASADQAVEKILRMIADRAQQERTIAKLEQRAALFTSERFVAGIRAIVERELKRRQIPSG